MRDSITSGVYPPSTNRSQRRIIRDNPAAKVRFSFETTKQFLKKLPIHIKISRYAQESKKEEKTSFKQIKNKKSWFKLVYFDIFLLIYFRFSTIIITFATKYQFKHTSNNLKRYINNLGA
jgi:Na+/melibiose symporter-like transporter